MKPQNVFIRFEDLKVHTIVGLLPFERKVPQPLILNLEAELPPDLNAQSRDELGNFPSYYDLALWMEQFVGIKKFKTLEALIQQSAIELFQKYPQIVSLSIEAKKPLAIPKARFSSVQQTFFK